MYTYETAAHWRYVVRRFYRFLENTKITDSQAEDGNTKQAGIRSCLNRWYYDSQSEVDNSMLIGSWGKDTRVRPSRDVDILFILPAEVYHRYEDRAGNKQSQILQEVKNALAPTYTQTTMRGDGQVVVVPFNTIPIEVSPGFRTTTGSIIVCNANDGGSYVTSTAEAELSDLSVCDSYYAGKARHLAIMLKQWQRYCDVPLKSFWLERLAVDFVRQWPYSDKDFYYYDWLCRDFFAYLLTRENSSIIMPGTYDDIPIGNDWISKAKTAHERAKKASEHERLNEDVEAGLCWQDIFGTEIPYWIS